MNATAPTLYFDGQCPFCLAEMTRLRGSDKLARLAFVDIAQPDFDPAFLGVDMTALNRELHSRTEAGEVLVGIDSLLAAYTLIGKGWRVLPLRVTFLRPPLAYLYRTFARNRYRISAVMGYKPLRSCTDGVCSTRHPF